MHKFGKLHNDGTLGTLQAVAMGNTCKFHSMQFQILSTYDSDFHAYLLQIYQIISKYDTFSPYSITFPLNNFKVSILRLHIRTMQSIFEVM